MLGDMNLENCTELAAVLPPGHASLNGDCQQTNTNVNGPKPYDHVIYDAAATTEINTRRGFTVIDLVDEMKMRWPRGAGIFPGDPYDHDEFRKLYSDHDPVLFSVRADGADDD